MSCAAGSRLAPLNGRAVARHRPRDRSRALGAFARQPRRDPAPVPGRGRRALGRRGRRLRRRSHRVLADWAAGAGARVSAIDPSPQDALVRAGRGARRARARARDEPGGAAARSRRAGRGDHRRRPQLLHGQRGAAPDRRARAGAVLPLLLLHDVGWPHGRRDDYYAPERIPAERPPADRRGRRAASRTSPGSAPAGCPTAAPAAREGGPRNGVLTAVEDFVAGARGPAARDRAGLLRPRRRLASPTRRGPAASPSCWSRGIAIPLLARLEANRVFTSRRRTSSSSSRAVARAARRAPGGGAAAAAGLERVRGRRAAVAPAPSRRRRARTSRWSPRTRSAARSATSAGAHAARLRRQWLTRRSGAVMRQLMLSRHGLERMLELALAGLVLELLETAAARPASASASARRARCFQSPPAWRPGSARPTSRPAACGPRPSPPDR